MEKSLIELGVVLVNYKNNEEIVFYIKEQLRLNAKFKGPIVLVDNESCPENIEYFLNSIDNSYLYGKETELATTYDSVVIIPQNENLGYAKGNNIGFRYLEEKYNVRNVLFSNSDILINDANIFVDLINKLNSNPKIGAINPKIIDKRENHCTPFEYESFIAVFVRLLLLPIFKLKDKVKTKKKFYTEGFYYRLSGSFLLMPIQVFKEIGMFDSNTFLFGEELIIAERLKQIDKECYYFPNCEIIHNHHQTINKYLNYVRDKTVFTQSILYYYTNYRGLPKWIGIICMFLLKIAFNMHNVVQKLK